MNAPFPEALILCSFLCPLDSFVPSFRIVFRVSVSSISGIDRPQGIVRKLSLHFSVGKRGPLHVCSHSLPFSSFSSSSGGSGIVDTGTCVPMVSRKASTGTSSSTISLGSVWVSALIDSSLDVLDAESNSHTDQNRPLIKSIPWH